MQTKNNFSKLREKYKRIIIISSQELIEQKLLLFIKKAADDLPSVVFLFFTRRQKNINNFKINQKNLLMQSNNNLYEYCKFCDFHTTVFSSFATESLIQGTPNIFININGLSKAYYSELLNDHLGVKWTNNVEQYIQLIENWNPPNNIKEISSKFFSNNNQTRIKSFLKDYL